MPLGIQSALHPIALTPIYRVQDYFDEILMIVHYVLSNQITAKFQIYHRLTSRSAWCRRIISF